jgi:phage major head subunit gpT-like protein
MGQVVTSDIVKNLLPGLKTTFMAGWNQVELPWQRIATTVDSTLPSETYGWLGQPPAVRQWTDERIPKGLSEFSYTIKNLKWEASVRVDAEVLEDEQYGQVKMRVSQLPGAIARHQNKLVFNALANGFSTLCYDGSNFFDTTHSENNSGTQVNKFTSLALNATNYATVRAAMALFKDDQGELIGQMGDTLVVPPALEGVARTILNADMIADTNGGGTTNVWKGSAELFVNPFLTDTNDWFLINTKAYIKPIVFQNRIPVQFKALDGSSDSDNAFMRDAYLYGVRARYNVGYGDWRTAVGVSN